MLSNLETAFTKLICTFLVCMKFQTGFCMMFMSIAIAMQGNTRNVMGSIHL